MGYDGSAAMSSSSMANSELYRLSLCDSAHWALFLDFDGTLVDIAPTPEQVKVAPELPGILSHLSRLLNGALALISGRSLPQLDKYLSPLCLPSAGLHGATIRLTSSSSILELSDHTPPAQLKDRLARISLEYQGCWLEDKGLSLAVHYRQAPELESALHQQLTQLLAGFAPKWKILPGKRVFEIKPDGYCKGTAIQRFMQSQPFCGRIPVFVGDDVTDQAGFAEVIRLQGYAVAVGKAMSEQRWWLQDPTAVLHWLSLIAAHLEAQTSPQYGAGGT